MLNILCTIVVAIGVSYLLRLGYYYVLKRQRLDWPLERKRFNQELSMMSGIMKRLMRWYWRV